MQMKGARVPYDVAIIGGGLGGLSLSIQLSKQGFSVILFEKEKYPFNKVCGEYISMEAWSFLEKLGVPLSTMNLPFIDTLQLSSPGGRLFHVRLPLGGFGISRYKLDAELAGLARESGVVILEETKVENVVQTDAFEIKLMKNTSLPLQTIKAKVCCAAYGKRSNLDVKWSRDFLKKGDKRLNNYVGVKYHIEANWPQQVIGLHNFENGYCGISKIEGERFCLCYLMKATNFKRGNLEEVEKKILSGNPHLKSILDHCRKKEAFPVTISQISFSKKTQVENGVLMIGDTAGMITPLCGNGMSMALHSSKIAAPLIAAFLQHKISQTEMEKRYAQEWKKEFEGRMRIGRLIQRFFGRSSLTNAFVKLFICFPFLASFVIKKTHGRPF